MTLGADLPGVELDEIGPLVQIEAAVTHARPGTTNERIFAPDQRLELDEALYAYTMGGARALRLDEEVGSITVGKSADLVILGQNPFEVPSHRIHAIPIDITLLAGRRTYQRT